MKHFFGVFCDDLVGLYEVFIHGFMGLRLWVVLVRVWVFNDGLGRIMWHIVWVFSEFVPTRMFCLQGFCVGKAGFVWALRSVFFVLP